jgi:hypothetical protein
MKNLIMFLMLISSLYLVINKNLIADIKNWQPDTENSFNDPHCPFHNDITMWILRQNITLDAYEVHYENTLPSSDTPLEDRETTIESFLPLYNIGNSSSMAGFNYNRHRVVTDDTSLQTSLYSQFAAWVPIEFRFNNWKILCVNEYGLNGDSSSLYDSTGNYYRIFPGVVYTINSEWMLWVTGVYIQTEQENGSDHQFLGAGQIRYQPNKDFKITIGAPILGAFEWSIGRFDLYASQMLLSQTESMFRYRVTDFFASSLYYKNEKVGESLLLNENTISENGTDYSYNKIFQFQQQVELQLGIKTMEDIGVIISGGYKWGDTVDLYLDDEKQYSVDGKNEYFIGADIQMLRL